MELSELTVVDPDRCQYLRWKGLLFDAPWDATVQHGHDRSFWCQKTQIVLGPDGRIVDEYECNPFRRCYEEL